MLSSVSSSDKEKSYSTMQQYDNEQTTCNYIHNVMSNAYTQEGEIVVNQRAWNTQSGYFATVDLGMAGWQVACLVFLIFGTIILAYMAFYLEPLVRVPNPGNKHLMHGPSHALYFS